MFRIEDRPDAPLQRNQIANSADKFNINIHYFRAIAAISVLLYHCGIYYDRAYGDDTYLLFFPSWLGTFGVAAFFAISGYLMAGLIKTQQPVEFLYRRIIRIFPLFVVLSCIGLAMRPAVQAGYNPLTLFLAPVSGSTYPLSVEWTLVHEVFFYVALTGISVVGMARFIPGIAVCWLIGIIAASSLNDGFLFGGEGTTIAYLPLMLPNIAFAFGLLIRSLKLSMPFLIIALLAAVAGTAFANGLIMIVLINIIASLCVAAAAQMQPISAGSFSGVLKRLGDYSYALYLVHALVLLTAFRLLPHSNLTMLIAIVAAISIGGILGRLDLSWHSSIVSAKLSRSIQTGVVAVFVCGYLLISVIYI